jgi:hypothetical protein
MAFWALHTLVAGSEVGWTVVDCFEEVAVGAGGLGTFCDFVGKEEFVELLGLGSIALGRDVECHRNSQFLNSSLRTCPTSLVLDLVKRILL